MLRLLLYGLLALITLIVLFYFWGSSSRLAIDEKHRLNTYDGVQPTLGADTFSVMTFNLGYLSGMTNNLPVRAPQDLFEDNLKATRNLLDDIKPDILGFQEVDYGSARSYHLDQMQALSENFNYGAMATNWDKRYVPFPYWPPSVHFGSMHSGQAILSTWPIVSQQVHVLQKPKAAPFYYNAFYLDRLVQQSVIQLPNSKVVVLNVHLEAFDTQTRESQAKALKALVDSLVQEGPLILMGDFNARPPFASEQITDEITMELFYQHPHLKPAIPAVEYNAAEQEHFTFDTQQPYEKLDYIFYNPAFINRVSARTVTEAQQISDHTPVIFTFALKP